MNQKIDRIGRTAAIMSSIVLIALLFNLWVLNATATEESRKVPQQQPMPYVPETEKTSWVDRIYEALTPAPNSADAVPVVQVSEELGKSRIAKTRFGKPVAYVNIDKLYLISKSGVIIGPADSCEHMDLPIFNSSSFLVDEERGMLVDVGTQNALRFLAQIQKEYTLRSLLSDIKIIDGELIAYMNLGRVVPVKFGQGDWDEKINKMVSYQKQLGASELTRQALYLDLRIKDRIVVKKNV